MCRGGMGHGAKEGETKKFGDFPKKCTLKKAHPIRRRLKRRRQVLRAHYLEAGLFGILRDLRNQVAFELNSPPSIVFRVASPVCVYVFTVHFL